MWSGPLIVCGAGLPYCNHGSLPIAMVGLAIYNYNNNSNGQILAMFYTQVHHLDLLLNHLCWLIDPLIKDQYLLIPTNIYIY